METKTNAVGKTSCPAADLFEMALANHCAPVLFGKKPAALFPERCFPKDCPWQLLYDQGFQTVRLSGSNRFPLILIYHPKLLEASLANEAIYNKLKEIGYPIQKNWRSLLGFLYKRFRESSTFPHEVGFFLGYPPEDVLGFMRCPKNDKLCGVWKVYGDEDQATRRFAEYARCREILVERVKSGGSILNDGLSALAG
ncbi:MAG: DUF3793 family protein [Fastidiosipilaceae bacterium]|jgi:hypothetical protein